MALSTLPPLHRLATRRAEEAVQVGAACGLHPLTVQVLFNRGLENAEDIRQFLSPGLDVWQDPMLLQDMDTAASLLAQAVTQNEIICVHGDYDCDGVSATALLVSFLRDIQAKPVWYIPHRIDEGYGISAEGVQWAADQGARLLVTVDCGTSSPAEVDVALQLGLKVIITDHHRVPPVLPRAHAVVNPQRPTCAYPFKMLSGVGVALKLVEATARKLGLPANQYADYLDLATLGTVGDVVSLTGENRFLVMQGLKRIQSSPRPGIAALLRACGASLPLSARDVAFKVVPPINASGRLDRAARAVELLLEEDGARCDELAAELVSLNVQRRDVEAQVTRVARDRVLARQTWETSRVIVEGSAGWHRGVVGIVASRLLDEFGVASLVISIEDEEAKGSARAPHGIDLFKCLSECSEVLSHYGGHPRAGGFSLKASDIPVFTELMEQAVARQLGAPIKDGCTIDAAVRLSELSVDLLRELERLAPFGEGNPEPLFLIEEARLSQVDYLKGVHARLQLQQDGCQLRGIQFGRPDKPACVPSHGRMVNLLIHAERDSWKGEERVNLRVRQIWADGGENGMPEGLEESRPEMGAASGPDNRLVDARHIDDKRRYLNGLGKNGAYIIGLVRSAPQARARFRYAVFNRLDEAIQMLAVAVPRIALVPYSGLRDGGELKGAEVVLLAPPPTLNHLKAPVYRAASRVHVMFNAQDVEEEREFYRASTVSQSKLNVLYQGLKRQLEAGPAVVSTAELAQGQSSLPMNRVCVEAGLKVFEELGLVRKDGGGALSLVKGPKVELGTSPTYQLYSTLSSKFEDVYRVLEQGPDGLKDLIWRSAEHDGYPTV